MNKEILNTIILAFSFLALFGIAELLYHFLKVKVELTRKLVHVGTGLLTLLFPVMLNDHWAVLFLCASFAVILVLSLRFGLLKSINAIDRESVGSIAYPVAVYGCYLAFDYFHQQYIFFYLPILILAISDPVAALFGKTWPIGKYKIGKDNKTLMGSGMFFVSAFLICTLSCLFLVEYGNISEVLIAASILSLFTTAAEAVSPKGLDNITIPAAALAGLLLAEKILSYGDIMIS